MKKLLARVVDVRPEEMRALGLACAFNFVILGSYYVIRPIRDDIAASLVASGGSENLSWMFTATLIAMLIANALFSAIVARMSRRRFIPIAYRFFMLNLVIFYVLMRTVPPSEKLWVGRAFYVWVSVFNLFVVTLFWAFMTDVFHSEQAKRLFAFISVGGSVGAIIGPIITASLVRKLGAPNLILVTAAMLEAGPWCVKFFPADFKRPGDSHKTPGSDQEPGAEKPVGGGIIAGISHIIRSPYLIGICAFLLLYTITSTIVYFQQSDIAGHQFHDHAARTAFFAKIDLSVNTLTIIAQLLITGRLLKWLGVGLTLAFLPVLSVFGFIGLGFMPVLALIAGFQILRRAANFGVTRPAREVLFTVLSREDKYKAKPFIDTFVYRTGDQIAAWTYPLLQGFGLGLKGISFVAAPLAGVWCLLSLWLGGRQRALARAREGLSAAPPGGAAAPEPA
jgi:ATP:ADP antiporter, AAA family